IQECLQGPALDLIKLHREVYPQDGSEELIELLEDTNGPVEDEIEMLYIQIQSCMQKDKESLSEYFKRLQQMLLLVCRRIIATYLIQSKEVNVLRQEKINGSLENMYSLKKSDSLKEEEITELKKEIAKLKACVSGRDEICRKTASTPGATRREPPKCFLCVRLGHISTNCNKQREEVVAAEVNSSGCDVKKLPQKRYRKRRSQMKCYTCGWNGHTSHSCDWGLNEESYDGYVTSFQCEKSCGMKMVSEHSGTPDKSERLGLGKCKPSGRGNVRLVSEKVFPCDYLPEVRENEEGQARTLPIQAGEEYRELVQYHCTYPCKRSSTRPVSVCCKLLPSNQLFSYLSAAGNDTAASECLAGRGSGKCWQKKKACQREPHGGQRERDYRAAGGPRELRGSTKSIHLDQAGTGNSRIPLGGGTALISTRYPVSPNTTAEWLRFVPCNQ
ncbi:hypothetical protein XELAEV_18044996mg, partial [Xenopus laevis]